LFIFFYEKDNNLTISIKSNAVGTLLQFTSFISSYSSSNLCSVSNTTSSILSISSSTSSLVSLNSSFHTNSVISSSYSSPNLFSSPSVSLFRSLSSSLLSHSSNPSAFVSPSSSQSDDLFSIYYNTILLRCLDILCLLLKDSDNIIKFVKANGIVLILFLFQTVLDDCCKTFSGTTSNNTDRSNFCSETIISPILNSPFFDSLQVQDENFENDNSFSHPYSFVFKSAINLASKCADDLNPNSQISSSSFLSSSTSSPPSETPIISSPLHLPTLLRLSTILCLVFLNSKKVNDDVRKYGFFLKFKFNYKRLLEIKEEVEKRELKEKKENEISSEINVNNKDIFNEILLLNSKILELIDSNNNVD
jgi:hypothetical protein